MAHYLTEKYYSKMFDIHFIIQYPNQIQAGQPICFAYKTNTFFKVEYCRILLNSEIFCSFLNNFDMFLHYSTWTNKKSNYYLFWIDFSKLNQIIYLFWFLSIWHYWAIYGESSQIIHFDLLCFTIWITSELICFNLF